VREDEFIAQLSRRLGRQKPSDVPPARTLPSGGMLSTRQRPLGEQAALVSLSIDCKVKAEQRTCTGQRRRSRKGYQRC